MGLKKIDLLPAVDIKDGLAVRLNKSNIDSIKDYGQPSEVINDFIAAGAKWIHLVDINAAFRSGNNREMIKELIRKIQIPIQLSGGIADQDALDSALSTSAKRINLATSSLLDIEWVKKVLSAHGDRISVSLDVSNEVLIARGSGEVLGNVFDFLSILNDVGCKRYVITDNSADGALTGPNLNLIQKILERTDASIIASGGVGKISDIDDLRHLGVEGVIVGQALYVGAVDLNAALKACSE